MGFERLSMWWVFPILLGLFSVYFLRWWVKRKKISGARNLNMLERPRSPILRQIFLLLAIVSICIAIISPTWGEGRKKVEVSGKDLIFLLDLSNSMLCRDVVPSRLAVAKLIIRELVSRGKGDRFAVIGFAGEARVFSPLTSSAGGFLKILEFLEPEVLEQGTDMNRALQKAVDMIERAPKRGKALIIITDGEFFGKGWEESAVTLGKLGVRTFVVGIGTPRGGRIILPDGSVKKDPSGKEVITYLRKSELERLSSELRAELLLVEEISPMEVVKRIEEGAEEVSRFHYITYSVPRAYIFTFLFFVFLSLMFYWERR